MIVSFIWASRPQYTGGVVALYEYANGLARLGHEVHFIHGARQPGTIERVEQIDFFRFEPEVRHHIVDSLDDPSLPEGDVVFHPQPPRRLGLPAVWIQGTAMISLELERAAFRARCPKFCVASWLIDEGLELGVPREQLLYVPLGIDHDVFRVTTPIEERPFHVALLYNSHPAKGWKIGRRAVEKARERIPELRVLVFGVLPPDEGLPDWMHFRCNPTRRELAEEVYNQAQVFVQPSHWEGFGFTAVEAMACGCALVSTDNGGSRDYAIPDETALVVEPGKRMNLAAAIRKAVRKTSLQHRLASAGTELVKRFDWDLAAKQLETHLERYLADPAALQREPAPLPAIDANELLE